MEDKETKENLTNIGGTLNPTGSPVGLYTPKELFEIQQDLAKQKGIPPLKKKKFGERVNNPSFL